MFRKAQQTVAHQSTLPSGLLGNRELKSLQEIINAEKEFVKSNSRSAQDFHKSAEALKAWAQGEGDDLQDILGKLSLLYDHYATSQNRFNTHIATIRQHFKSIRTREESLAELKARKRSLGSKIESVEKKLQKMSPENKELPKTTQQLKELRNDMDGLRNEVATEEAALGDFKRRSSKEAMSIKCAGLLEFAEKMRVVAEVGKLMLEEIPLEPTEPGHPREVYRSQDRTDELLHDATQSIADVGFATGGASSGRRPEIGRMPSNMSGYNNSGMNYYDSTGDMTRETQGADNDNQGYGYEANEWNEAGVGAGRDHTNGHERETYSLQDPQADQGLSRESGGAHSPTPIYAQHSSSGRSRDGTGNRLQSHDSATNNWNEVRQELPASASGRAVGSGSTPIADQFQSRSPDEVQVGGSGLRVVGNSSDDSLSRNNRSGDAPSSAPRLATPPSHDDSLGYDRAAAQYADGHAPSGPSTPAAIATTGALSTTSAQDDETYFQNVGSTRAARQAMRRPMSPGAGSTARPFSSALGYGNAPESPGAPGGEGRKMTAAAFRKGFNRAPSSQQPGGQFGASTTSLGGAINRPGSAAGSMYSHSHPAHHAAHGENGDSSVHSATAPLAIRKPGWQSHDYSSAGAYSAQHDGPAPPYEHQQAGAYGGMQPHDASSQYATPQPYDDNYARQPWHQ